MVSSHQTHLFEGCSIAVALNNMGVSLLERAAYKDAMVALQDAMIVMRHTIISSTTQEATHDNESCTCFSNKLQRTTRNLANVCSQPRCEPSTKSYGRLRVQAISQNDGYTVPGTIYKANESSNLAFPIRIETMSKYSTQARHLDILSSTIFYNIGIANLCLFSLKASRRSAQTIREQAMAMFDVSFCTIEKYLRHKKLSNTLLVTLVAMKYTYSMLLRSTKRADEEKENNPGLVELIDAAQKMEQMESYEEIMQVAPAA